MRGALSIDRRLVVVAALGAIACGPPRLGVGSSGDESGDAATSSSTELGTESDTSDTADPTSESSEGPVFLPEPDAPPFQCDPFAQDCPDGEKCVPYGSTGGNWDDHKCVPVTGDQAPGEPCTYGGVVEATDDCDETSACWDVMDVDGRPIGTCTAFCMGTADNSECPPGSVCLHHVLNFCINTCDPIIQDCGPGLACYWANGNFNCIFTTQDIPAGQPCGYINDCAAGLGCLTGEVLPDCAGSACCSAFCELELGDAACEASLPGTACVAFFEENQAPPGYEHIGVCILPP